MTKQDFVQSRQSILVNESLIVSELQEGQGLKTVDGKLIYKENAIAFVQWKQKLLNLIRDSDENALRKRLTYLKTKLCKKCKIGLKDSECHHPTEYKTFVACLWIQESLK